MPVGHHESPKREPHRGGKNPHAVALGKLGGLKGGPARTHALTDHQRQEAAQHAAYARWKKR